jgi:hypothetical protein
MVILVSEIHFGVQQICGFPITRSVGDSSSVTKATKGHPQRWILHELLCDARQPSISDDAATPSSKVTK